MSFRKIDGDDTRPEGKKAIIVYSYDEAEVAKIKDLAERHNVQDIFIVNKEQSGLTLREILDGASDEKAFKGAVSRRSIIMHAFSNKGLQDFIEEVKKLDIGKPIFAVVTETSEKWKLGQLVKELVMENMMMSKAGKGKRH